jgi:hypothetical protein
MIRGLAGVPLAGVLLIVLANEVLAQPVKAHMEACTRWEYVGGEFGTLNRCDTPVTIQFMALNEGRVIERNVAPGDWFGSGTGDLPDGWIFTACPVGYAPSVRVAPENKDTILVSLYNCRPGRPDV